MIENLSTGISLAFVLTTLLTIFLFYKATVRSTTSLFILLGWIVLQAAVSLSGFYLVENTFPPRMALLAGPALIFILILFLTAGGRHFLDSLDLKMMTWLH